MTTDQAIARHELALAVCRECVTRPSQADIAEYAAACRLMQSLGVDVRYHADGTCTYGDDSEED